LLEEGGVKITDYDFKKDGDLPLPQNKVLLMNEQNIWISILHEAG